ncbi:MAG: NAD-dependent epimerase/dehydratase [Actinomycetia bacterium]|nr:NAD-dependent epimerase/dehydratase [Actinomycetes bacterium]
MLVTGATGRVGFPIARELARDHEVFGLARCRNEGDEARLRDHGITPLVADLGELDPATQLPDGLTHVFHAGAALHQEARANWQRTFRINAEQSGRLVAACATDGFEGFVYCSTGSAYEYQGARPLREDDPPGVHLGTYSLSKIAGEAVVRFAAVEHGVPVTIIKIFSTYGPEGGAPADRFDRIVAGKEIRLHPDAPNRYNPIYEDDYVRHGIRALEVADVPPVVVNWCGSETVSAEDYCAYLGELVGIEPRIVYDPEAPWPIWPDPTHMHEVLGRTQVPWRDGMRRMAEARHPEAVKGTDSAKGPS